jgi:hypothetical protein
VYLYIKLKQLRTDVIDKLHTERSNDGAGLAPREEMQTTCCYALQDKAWVQDPDGNKWEVFVVLKHDLGEEAKKSDEATCCTLAFTKIDGKKQKVATACC